MGNCVVNWSVTCVLSMCVAVFRWGILRIVVVFVHTLGVMKRQQAPDPQSPEPIAAKHAFQALPVRQPEGDSSARHPFQVFPPAGGWLGLLRMAESVFTLSGRQCPPLHSFETPPVPSLGTTQKGLRLSPNGGSPPPALPCAACQDADKLKPAPSPKWFLRFPSENSH